MTSVLVHRQKHAVNDSFIKKVLGKLKIETSPVLVLDEIIALRS